VHRVVLEGKAPGLAAYYPSVGGVAEADAAWPEFQRVVAEHPDEIRALLASPPQTNEVGRATILMGALLRLTSTYQLPVRLLDVGASAGLNLRVDAFRYELTDDTVLGDPASPVVLREPWSEPRTTWPSTEVTVTVAERLGCDTDPADPLTPDGQLRLTSYVWPDQVERLARLRGAFEVAARIPAPVERARAVDFLGRQLSAARPGMVTVVWHSVVWQYLDQSERIAVGDLLRIAGERATADAPVAHVAFEPVRPTPDRRYAFLGSMTVWPGGNEQVIAEGQGHGPPVTWR
jgi:hypothetical protein